MGKSRRKDRIWPLDPLWQEKRQSNIPIGVVENVWEHGRAEASLDYRGRITEPTRDTLFSGFLFGQRGVWGGENRPHPD